MQPDVAPKPVRCAIYTRKSTEEGLDQEFNSLDAQRECAEAYVLSQRHERWTAIEKHFDDGGFTGANIERPALKEMLAEIEAGRVDCVVVYKVDRLSRSLLDFARIMEVFDKRGVTFVSVTQQLNTNSPMGRLTLNVLLSFAQFEREIISERTRDKISAARRKGKWTGGTPVIGYDADPVSRKLVVNELEAKVVRSIFAYFAHSGSLKQTLEEIDRRGWRNKTWTTRKSKHRSGGQFTRPTLVNLLTNVTYLGEVNHKGERFPGEHASIVSSEVWTKVNQLLGNRKRGSDVFGRKQQGALLQGLLCCTACGHPMVAGYTAKQARRYRYYACGALRKRGVKACPGQMVSDRIIEKAVLEKVFELGCVSPSHWESLNATERRHLLSDSIERINYDHSGERALMRLRRPGVRKNPDIEITVRKIPYERHSPIATAVKDEPALAGIARRMALAVRLDQFLAEGVAENHAALAQFVGVSTSRMSQLMKMRDLAPAIQETLLFWPEGARCISEPALRRIASEPDWGRQQTLFERLVGAE
jgi:DNA invertase Pin-like site-specific DNA recombinase